MINVHFVILGAAISLGGACVYAWDTLQGRTHPNRVTWLLWGVIPMVAFAVELQSGVGLIALMTFSIGLGPLLVLAASCFNRTAVWRIRRLDYVCGALSLAGVVVWVTTERGAVAIVASIVADALAGLPTLIKSWRAPETESAAAYWGALANATITLLTVTTATFAVLAFPCYIVVVAGIELVLIAGRAGPRWRARAWRRAAPGEPAPQPTGRGGAGP